MPAVLLPRRTLGECCPQRRALMLLPLSLLLASRGVPVDQTSGPAAAATTTDNTTTITTTVATVVATIVATVVTTATAAYNTEVSSYTTTIATTIATTITTTIATTIATVTAIDNTEVPSAPNTTYTPAPTSHLTTSTATTTTGGLVVQANAPDSPSSIGSKSSPNTIAIAAGAIAGSVVIAVAALICFLVRKNRRRRNHQPDPGPPPVNQHRDSGTGGRPRSEEPQMYLAASGPVPFIPTSRPTSQVVNDPYNIERPWIESSQSDDSPPCLVSSTQRQTLRSSNIGSSSRSDLGNPSEGASSSQPTQPPQRKLRVEGGGGGRGGGLVLPEKLGLLGLPPGASPPIPGGMGGGRVSTPDAALIHRPTKSPPPQYEG
ncbi:hypothetical protein FRB95_008691 [Tulasnella sp. JGI-2019a]|nr:hypothetical protein FRB95_008691 [Tulasnella sp. JGI-2019a]